MLFWGSWAIFLCPKMKFPCLAWFSTSADSFVFINLNCNPHLPPPSPLLSPPTAGSNVLTYHNHFIPHALYLQVDILFVFNFWNCTHTHTHTPITATVSHTHEPRTFAHEPACIQRALNIMWTCETNRLIFFSLLVAIMTAENRPWEANESTIILLAGNVRRKTPVPDEEPIEWFLLEIKFWFWHADPSTSFPFLPLKYHFTWTHRFFCRKRHVQSWN